MQFGEASRTAMGAAAHRAAHQVLEGGRIFKDPLALAILGEPLERLQEETRHEAFNRKLRLFIAFRARFVEDTINAQMPLGLRQLVILGAGLDTYAYRNPFGIALRVFEVDHPATQNWKRQRLSDAGIAIPAALTFAPVDFERETLGDGLAAAGFDPRQPALFSWLGVVPYLSETAVFATLGFVASLTGGAQVVFDYANPAAPGDPSHAGMLALATRVAASGEAFASFFETDALCARLREVGFTDIDDLGPAQLASRYFPASLGATPVATSTVNRGGHIMLAGRSRQSIGPDGS